MNAALPPPGANDDERLVPAPAFLLGSALVWLGHNCPSECSKPIEDLAASVWFIRRKPVRRAGFEGKIVVEVTGPPDVAARIRNAIRVVNDCAGADGIQVYGRRRNRGGRALILLEPGSS
jgi:hypothetical protein